MRRGERRDETAGRKIVAGLPPAPAGMVIIEALGSAR
jgi:hypothetical protein